MYESITRCDPEQQLESSRDDGLMLTAETRVQSQIDYSSAD